MIRRLDREIAEALAFSVGLSPAIARKAAIATLQTLAKPDRVARIDDYVLLVSAHHATLGSRSLVGRLDRPTFVSSLSHMVSAATKASEQTIEAATNVLDWASEPLQAAMGLRVIRALTEIVRDASQETLTKAAAAQSDFGALLAAIEATAERDALSDDELTNARIRGFEARRQLLEMDGVPWNATTVAKHLGITRQGVDRRRRANKLIAVISGKRAYIYPSWQFSQTGVLEGLESVMAELATHDPWSQVIFFVNPNARLDGRSPLKALRAREIENVRAAAAAFDEHGAA